MQHALFLDRSLDAYLVYIYIKELGMVTGVQASPPIPFEVHVLNGATRTIGIVEPTSNKEK